MTAFLTFIVITDDCLDTDEHVHDERKTNYDSLKLISVDTAHTSRV